MSGKLWGFIIIKVLVYIANWAGWDSMSLRLHCGRSEVVPPARYHATCNNPQILNFRHSPSVFCAELARLLQDAIRMNGFSY